MDSVLLAQVNSLVGDYLSSLNPKLAAKFKKETKAGPLPSGSPSLMETVKHFNENPLKKRKLEMNGHANGHAPAKKAKKVSYPTCLIFNIPRGVMTSAWACNENY